MDFAQSPETDSDSYIVKWIATDDGRRSEEEHVHVWVDDETLIVDENLVERLFWLGLIDHIAKQKLTDSLPAIEQLSLTAEEKRELLTEIVDYAEEQANAAGLHVEDARIMEEDAVYTLLKKGLLGGKRQTRFVTVSDWGETTSEAL